MSELNLTVGEIYNIVFYDRETPEEIYGIFKEKQTRQYITQEYRKSIGVEPDYELQTDYLFMDDANPNRTIRIEDWEIKHGMIEIIPVEIPIK